ncbi:type I-E CRISPR-associated protein Cse2/CasB [Aromatoleum toluvorans]|uniref:Type I-E CRISPR-associated protein Cse2/CasB n=1 Tax=Aromatoleum toluvorans TaxID=92002 RepID=A0ABX1PZ85_9RHOO|nr:type I-E CRISPR-associated protein Cse2/CasB [Aromatoleum toluvorans]NMG44764.1 type I-E CRISPR-associated protein Cse2/CasB [Aromatoleum toluvorans]
MTEKLRFLSPAQAETVRNWWYALQPHSEDEPEPNKRFSMFTRRDRAELRRCETPDQVLLLGAFVRLAHALLPLEAGKQTPYVEGDATAYALVAGLLAHVETDLKDGSSFGARLGETNDADRPHMSAMRFARLQTASTEAEFFQLGRRAIQLVGKKADVVMLADDLLAWVREFRGHQPGKPKDRLRVRWATEYFTAAKHLESNKDLA